MLISIWSCTPDTEMAGIQDVSRLDQQNVISLAKAYYGIEKQDQASSLARLHLGLGIYPYWGGAKTCQNGRMVIVPAYRNVQVVYAKGYLRRFVFELDQIGNVTRGGILEL